MLAKIHLKTACGCTREMLQSIEFPTYTLYVPISFPTPYSPPMFGPSTTHSRRRFEIVDGRYRSSCRVELWYEEVVNV